MLELLCWTAAVEKVVEINQKKTLYSLHRKGIESYKYLLPNLVLREQPDRDLGKYGRMRLRYLKEHRPVLWGTLTVSGKLYQHLLEIEDAANSRLEAMMPELAKAAGATEQLKARDQMRWVGLMNNCKAQAEEIILSELVYS